MKRRHACSFLSVLVAHLASGGLFGATAQTLRPARGPALIGAASDLKFVLTEIVAQLERETPHRFALNLGSSGNLTQQIQHGLPVELFLSADEAYVFQLADAGLTRDKGQLYAIGRIALFVPQGSPIALDPELRGLKAQWSSVTKFSIANPAHAPYGRAAREALQKLGMWEMVQPRLVMGENISQATQFVSTGAAQAGIVALSLALAPDVGVLGRHVLLPATLHEPLRQRMALLKSASPAAEALYAHLQSPEAKALLQKYGFAVT